MHELILNALRDQPGTTLARFPLDDGALVCGFHAGGLRWVAKTAVGEAGIRRLRAEAMALEQLDPWAESLGTPRRLYWHDGAAAPDGVACLLQSGVPGARATGLFDARQPWAAVPPELRRVAAWLRQFQAAVPLSRPLTLAALEQDARIQAESACSCCPAYASLLLLALAALPELPDPHHSAVRIHGDFWYGNVLFDPPSRPARPAAGTHVMDTHVIDWSGLGAGTTLDDLLTWTAHLRPRRGALSRLERWQALFFSPGTVRDFLRDWSLRAGYADRLARWAFYVFLLRRMGWELGFGLQSRNAVERERAQQEWTEIMAWLSQHRYPDPFTPMPV